MDKKLQSDTKEDGSSILIDDSAEIPFTYSSNDFDDKPGVSLRSSMLTDEISDITFNNELGVSLQVQRSNIVQELLGVSLRETTSTIADSDALNTGQTKIRAPQLSYQFIVKMLVIVVAVFGLCWLPIHVFTLVMDYNPQLLQYATHDDAIFVMALFLSVHWLAMSNSFANPIIYGFTNESFRADLATLFYLWFPCCGFLKNVIPRTTSSSCTTYDSVVLRRQSTVTAKKCKSKSTSISLTKPIYNGYHDHKKYSALRQSSKESTTEDC